MIVLVVRAFTGPAIARAIRFPLLFLLFLAPLGEELVPILMDITADLTVGAIALTGIPIYREGLFFSLPSGDWSVVEACSGIRYLIASIVLGSLYAHLSLEGTVRKLAFVALAAIVPIVANGIRAFLIVMIGHLSSMELATGADHLVYGWLFFGVVMFALFSVGTLFQRVGNPTATDGAEGRAPGASRADIDGGPSRRPSRPRRPIVARVALVAAGVLIWPLWAGVIDARTAGASLSAEDLTRVMAFDEASPDEIDARVTTWRPHIGGHDAVRRAIIDVGVDRPPVLALAHVYARQRQGKEMISSSNVLVTSRDPHWRRLESGTTTATFSSEGTPGTIEQSRLASDDGSLLVRRWYRVDGTDTGEALRAKLLEARNRLLLRTAPSVAYVLAADATDRAAAEAALDEALLRLVGPGK